MNKFSILLLAAITFVFVSCQEEATPDTLTDTSTSANDSDLSLITAETIQQATAEDIDFITDQGFEHVFNRVTKMRFRKMDCAEITRDTVNHILTVDFGTGCEDPKGRVRSGQIIIEHSGDKREAGSSRTVTLVDFSIGDITVEGTRTTTIISSDSSAMVLETVLTGGKITINDSTYTRESTIQRTIVRGESGSATITGSASGVLVDGTEYTSTIIDAIVFDRTCENRIPVAGVKEFIAGDNSISIDYGDGTCDNFADVTINGETSTIELESKVRKAGKGDGVRGGKGKGRKGPKGK